MRGLFDAIEQSESVVLVVLAACGAAGLGIVGIFTLLGLIQYLRAGCGA